MDSGKKHGRGEREPISKCTLREIKGAWKEVMSRSHRSNRLGGTEVGSPEGGGKVGKKTVKRWDWND